MITRTISGLIGGLLVIVALIFNQTFPFIINLIIALVCVLSTYEIFSAMGIKKEFEIILPSMVFSAILPLVGFGFVWQVFLYLYTLLIFSIMLFCNKYLKFKDTAVVYSMTLLLTLSLSAVVEIKTWAGVYSNYYLLFTFVIAWISDTGAYFAGTFFGKHKFCPEISPKKTIEGVIGGIICCVLANVLISLLFTNFWFMYPAKVNYWWAILISIIGSLISVIGDLCFSFVKRGCRIKDFGNIIPGHGGILDRFDSLIFVAPFVYIMVRMFNLLV